MPGAQAAYQLVIDSGHPDVVPLAAANLGSVLGDQQDVAGARAAFQLAIDSAKNTNAASAAAMSLGKLLNEQGDVAGAQAACRLVIESGHVDEVPEAAFNLGVLRQ